MGRLGTFTDADEMTDRQRAYVTDLTRDLVTLTADILRAGGDNAGADAFLAGNGADVLASVDALNKRTVRDRIDDLKINLIPTLRATLRAMSAPRPSAMPAHAAPVELDTDAIYRLDGRFVRIYRSKTTNNLYAKILDTDTRRWEYAPGVARDITPGHKMTTDEVAELDFSWCIRCGKDLSDPESIARRMGATCYSYQM